MKKRWKSFVAFLILITMLTQTSYSAVANIINVDSVYAYADDQVSGDAAAENYNQEEDQALVESPAETPSAATTETTPAETVTPETPAETVTNPEVPDTTEKTSAKLTAAFTDTDGNAIMASADFDFDDNSIYLLKDKVPAIEGYSYKKTQITLSDGSRTDIQALKKDVSDTAVVYSWTSDAGAAQVTWIPVEADTTVTVIYEAAKAASGNTASGNTASSNKAEQYKVTADCVDEFGDEIESKYTGIDIADIMGDGKLVLTESENAPVAIKNYTFEKATIDGTAIKDIKADTKDNLTTYSYTTDGSSYTDITEDTTVKFVYTDGRRTEYEYEDDDVYVKVTLQHKDAVPADAELVVKEVVNKARIAEDLEKVKDTMSADSTIYNSKVYDIHFKNKDNDEIEPESGNISVEMSFKTKILTASANEVKDRTVNVFHIDEKTNEAVDMQPDVSSTKAGISEVAFTTDSFSDYVIATGATTSKLDLSGYAGSDNYESVLGSAWYYGITADTWNFNGEAETNCAVNNFAPKDSTSYGGQTGNTPTISSKHQSFVLGNMTGKSGTVTIKGATASITMQEAQKGFINTTNTTCTFNYQTKAQMKTYVDGMISKVASQSKTLAGYNSLGSGAKLPAVDNGGKITLDFTNAADNKTYYIDVTGIETALQNTSGLTIKKLTGQTIVFTDTNSTVSLYKYEIYDGSTHYDSNSLANISTSSAATVEHIIWNLPNATTVYLDTTAGVFLAPNATVNWSGVGGGWLVCKTANSGAEWHSTNGELPDTDTTPVDVNFTATKNVNGTAAKINGFKFTLSEKVNGTWTALQSDVTNSGSSIAFNAITYDSSDDVGTHYYRISEASSQTLNGTTYTAATTAYYAKVVVGTKSTLTGSTTTTAYTATTTYYSDETFSTALSGASALIFNNTEKKTDASITGTKWFVTDDASLLGKSFTFTLTNTTNASETYTATCTPAKQSDTFKELNGSATVWDGDSYGLGSFTFNLSNLTVGDHIYKLTESAVSGLDTPEYKYQYVKFTVADNLKVTKYISTDGSSWTLYTDSSSVKDNPLWVKNTYTESASAYTKLVGYKALSGKTFQKEQFDFTLYDSTGSGNVGNKIVTVQNNAATSGTVASFTFGKTSDSGNDNTNGALVYTWDEYKAACKTQNTTAPSFWYAVKETSTTTDTKWTYDTTVYYAKVTLTYSSGKLTASTVYYANGGSTPATDFTFTNIYQDYTETPLLLTKKVGGASMPSGLSGKFGFTLSAVTSGAPMPAVATVTNDANGTVQWGNITYKAAGTYVYKISETTAPSGYTKAADSYATVVVEKNDTTGKLTVTSTKYGGSQSTCNNTSLTVNDDVTYTPVSAAFEALKTLDNGSLAAGQFSFVLKDSAGNVIQTKQNAASGKVTFSSISYIAPGTYNYTISEVSGNTDGIVYDTSVYNVKVVVAVTDIEKNTLGTTVTYTKTGATTTSNEADFTNTKIDDTSLPFKAVKYINAGGVTGTATAAQMQDFVFNITSNDPDYAANNATITGSDGIAKFTDAKYTLADVGKTYTYTITESQVSGKAYILDKNTYTVDVTIGKGKDGKLTKSVTVNNGGTGSADGVTVSFTNSVQPTSAAITIVKQLSGLPTDTETRTFTFKLYSASSAADTSVPASETEALQSKTVSVKNGTYTVTFDSIDYNAADTYYYKVVEESADSNVKAASVIKVASVTVTSADGKLSAKVNEDTEALTFVNTYSVGSPVIYANKVLNGRKIVDGDDFTFTLTKPDGSTNTAVADKNGVAKFENFAKYSLNDVGKTYVYTLTEVKGNRPNVTYDTTSHEVDITVIKDTDGKVGFSYLYSDGKTAQSAVFTNSYEAKGSFDISGKKTIAGLAKDIKAGDFTFTIYDAEGKALAGNTAVPCADGGAIRFNTINYTMEDLKEGTAYAETRTFTYFIVEDGAGTTANGMTYTKNAYKVEVTVSNADHDGKLDTTAGDIYRIDGTNLTAAGTSFIGAVKSAAATFVSTITGSAKVGNFTAADFENTYEAEGKFQIQASKTLNGRDWKEGDSFTVKAVESGKRDSVQTHSFNTADHSDYVFNYTYTEPGIYTYTVTETKENIAGVTYDTTVYTKTVEVKDNGKGKLIPYGAGTATETDAITAPFKNSYDAHGDFTVNVVKSIAGSKLIEDFNFTLYSADSSWNKTGTLGTATVKADKNSYSGTASFETRTYGLEAAGKTYNYIVEETAGNNSGITYDTTPRKISVRFTDNGTGILQKEVTVDSGSATTDDATVYINNEYSADGSTDLQAHKYVADKNGKRLVLDPNKKFKFQLFDVTDGKESADADYPNATEMDENGTVTFRKSYTADDIGKTYTYRIREDASTEFEGYTNTKAYYDAVVKITDAGNGKLGVEKKYYDASGAELATGELPGFTNELNGNVELDIDGTKTFSGANAAKNFNFALTGQDVVYSDTQTVNFAAGDKANKSFSFKLAYTLTDLEGANEKTFHYLLTETPDTTDKSVDYNAENVTYEVAVRVYLEGSVLKAVKTVKQVTGTPVTTWWKSAITGSDSVIFKNTYGAKGEYVLSGKKTMNASDTDASGYTFIVYDKSDVKKTVLATGKSAADGTITFDNKLTYTLDDTGDHTYVMEEINIPDGVFESDSNTHTFTINVADNGTGKLNADLKTGSSTAAFEFENSTTKIYVDKKDITDSEELPGAKMQVLKPDGTEFISWTSGTTAKLIEGLTPGTEYTLRETTAPDGYTAITDTTFMINENGQITVKTNGNTKGVITTDGNTMTVNDTCKPIYITKYDLTGSKQLDGEEFTITCTNPNVVITDAKVDGMKAYMIAGAYAYKNATYTIHESKAPAGYAVCDDVKFTINADVNGNRKIEVDGSARIVKNTDGIPYIEVLDAPIVFYVDKFDASTNGYLAKAKLEIQDASGTAVKSWTTGSGAEKISDLAAGTYTLVETEAPSGYKIANPVRFTITDTGLLNDANGNSLIKSDGTYRISMYDEKIGELAFNGEKIWVDGNDGTGHRPESITIYLDRKLTNETSWTEGYKKTTATKSSNYKFSFSGSEILSENAAGTKYDYRMREEMDTETAKYYTTANTIVASPDASGAYVFTNTLKQEYVKVNVTKTWDVDATGLANVYDGFTVTLYRKSGNSAYAAVDGKTHALAGPATANTETFYWDKLPKYDDNGFEYTYKAVETLNTAENSYSWTGTTEGYGEADAENNINIALTNVHGDMGTDITVGGTKAMNNSASGKKFLGGFTFGLYYADGANKDKLVNSTVTSASDGKFTFASISYNEAEVGKHNYYIQEINDGQAGFTYDTAKYPVVVTVAYTDNSKAAIKATAVYDNGSKVTNIHSASGNFVISGTKSVKYGTTTRAISGTESYAIICRTYDKQGTLTGTDYKIVNAGNADYRFEFSYAAEGNYRYVVSEAATEQELAAAYAATGVKVVAETGVTYDTSSAEYNVTVTDNGTEKLDVAATDKSGAAVNDAVKNFENSYDAKGHLELTGKKTFSNSEITKDGQFNVIIKRTDAGHESSTTIPVAKDGTFKYTEDFGLSDVGTEPLYEVTEEQGSLDNVTYSKDLYNVSVSITDNHDGTLDVEPSVSGSGSELSFVNSFDVKGQKDIHAKKTISGANLGTYSFTLTPDPDNNINEAVKTAENNGSGDILFSVSYNSTNVGSGKTKTFKYVLAEKVPSTNPSNGVTYDTKKYLVSVKVKNTGEVFTVDDPVYTELDGTSISEQYPTFKNSYSGKTSIDVTGIKDWDYDVMPDGGFTFNLYSSDGTLLDQKNVNKSSLGFKFNGSYFSYTEKDLLVNGDYKDSVTKYYYVAEDGTDTANITYDKNVYAVAVTITKNADGTLSASKTVTAGTKTAAEKAKSTGLLSWLMGLFTGSSSAGSEYDMTFVNKLVKNGELPLAGTKTVLTLDGKTATLADYESELKDVRFIVKDKATGDTKAVGSITDFTNGTITYVPSTISYNSAGDYQYTVTETMASGADVPAGFVFDKTKSFTVKVTNEGNNGKLKAVVTDGNAIYTTYTSNFENRISRVVIDKQDFDKEKVINADIKIIDNSEKRITEWVSDGTAHTVDGLEIGKPYTLVEVSAPDGYKKITNVVFHINDSGKVIIESGDASVNADGTIVLVDKTADLVIRKTDLAGTKLGNAKLEIREGSETGTTVVASETSSETDDWIITGDKFKTGTVYYLVETSAPSGYALTKSIAFRLMTETNTKPETTRYFEILGTDGVTWSKIGTDNVLVMKDAPISIEIEKQFIGAAAPEEGAELELVDEKGSTVLKWNTKTYPTVTLSGDKVPAGTYILKETKVPDGFIKAADVKLVISADGTLTADGEKVTDNKFKLANKPTDKIVVNGTKSWNDENNIYNTRPDSISINLLRDGNVINTVQALKSNGYSYSFTTDKDGNKLSKTQADGKTAYKYTVEEAPVNGYVLTGITEVSDNQFNITNTVSGETSFTVNKAWVTPDDKSGYTDDEMTYNIFVVLYQNGTAFRNKELKDFTAKNNFTYTFENLPKYDNTGKIYQYTASETVGVTTGTENRQSKLSTTTSGNKTISFNVAYSDVNTVSSNLTETITNTLIDPANIEIEKVWVDGTDKLTIDHTANGTLWKNAYVTLYQNGSPYLDANGKTVTMYFTATKLANGNYTYSASFTGMPRCDASGKLYKYTVSESGVPGYAASVSEPVEKDLGKEVDYTITNTLSQDYVDIPYTKTWVENTASAKANRPDVTFTLYRTDADGTNKTKMNSRTWSASDYQGDTFSASFTTDVSGNKLDKYDDKRDAYIYTVEEDHVDGYVTKVVSGNGTTAFTNTAISMKILKKDAGTKESVSGAVICVSANDGSGRYWDFETPNDLELTIGSTAGAITPGYYTVSEKKAPTGYNRSTETFDIQITSDGKVLNSKGKEISEISMTDLRYSGKAGIRKTESGTNKPLAGAVFELYSKTPHNGASAAASTILNAYYRYGTYTTGSDGTLEVDNLPWDDYFFVEVKAPAGYTCDPNQAYTFTIDENHTYGFNTTTQTAMEYQVFNSSTTTTTTTSTSTSTTTSTTSTTTSTSTTSTSSSTTSSTSTTTSTSTGKRTAGGLIGGVLGVRKGPSSGVLGDRSAPVTGDCLNLTFWLMLLCVAGIVIMQMIYSDKESKKKKSAASKQNK